MEEERDFVVFTDEDGNDFELDVIDYFSYEDEEYAVLVEPETDEEEDEEEEREVEVYIMKVETQDDYEEFLPPDEDKMEVLSAIVEERMKADGCCCGDDDCDCGGDDCDCGCHKHE